MKKRKAMKWPEIVVEPFHHECPRCYAVILRHQTVWREGGLEYCHRCQPSVARRGFWDWAGFVIPGEAKIAEALTI